MGVAAPGGAFGAVGLNQAAEQMHCCNLLLNAIFVNGSMILTLVVPKLYNRNHFFIVFFFKEKLL